ncbi:hypothetical protein ACTJMV_24310, partial [Enterobacter hormaechei]
MPLRITPSVAEQEGQQTETEATGAPQKHHYTLNQQVGSITQFCPELHLKRLNSLTLACHALLDCKTLTLTELGRNLPTKART